MHACLTAHTHISCDAMRDAYRRIPPCDVRAHVRQAGQAGMPTCHASSTHPAAMPCQPQAWQALLASSAAQVVDSHGLHAGTVASAYAYLIAECVGDASESEHV